MSTPVQVSIGDEVFAEGATVPFGAVRKVSTHELVVDIEGFGDAPLRADVVLSVHDHKVIVDPGRLPPQLRDAIAHAHDAEDPNVSSR